MTRFWKYYVSGELDLNYHRMNNALSGLAEFDNNGIHEAFLSNLYATPQVDYERNVWRASFSVPLKWLHYSIAGQHDYINASPRLYVRRQLTAKSDISASAAYSLGSPRDHILTFRFRCFPTIAIFSLPKITTIIRRMLPPHSHIVIAIR